MTVTERPTKHSFVDVLSCRVVCECYPGSVCITVYNSITIDNNSIYNYIDRTVDILT